MVETNIDQCYSAQFSTTCNYLFGTDKLLQQNIDMSHEGG